MIERHLSPVVRDAAAAMPVVTLIGPRQSGKTTLVRHLFPDHEYISLERPDLRRRAADDPLGLLATPGRGLILDEVHRVPDLLSYIQVDVDADDRPGRFILTGSQNFLLMERVSQTLAGRTSILHLLPLSLAELCGREPLVPSRLAERPSPARPPERSLWETLWAGFYPRIHDRGLDPTRWLADYCRTYVERDVRDVLRVQDLDAFDRFVRLAASHTGRELNLNALASDVGISQPTVRQWLTVLRISSLATLLQPHHVSYRKRLRKRPKLHFLDTGLVCYLLGIHEPSQLERHPLRGSIFESYVVAELTKAFANAGREAPLYHWRDAAGHEVDVIIDLGERLLPLEAKSGATVPADALDELRWWTGLPGNSNRGGALIHGGLEAYASGPFAVRPWYIGS